MNQEEIIKFITDKRLISAAIVILVTILLYIIIKKLINKRINRIKNIEEKKFKKKNTYLKVLDNVFKYLFIIVDIIIILQIYGVDVGSIVAGLSIVSVITGLALQDAFKDIIAGFNIIVDDYFSIGDVIKIDEVEGKIIEIKVKTTKLKDINNENVFIVANRNIEKALRVSKQLDIDIPLHYEEKIENIETILKEIVEIISKNEKVEDVKYLGINQFADSSIIYKIRIWCNPELKAQLKRDVLTTIKIKLDEENIEIPYNQLDIHQK